MGIKTTQDPVLSKKEKIPLLLKHHEGYFKKKGIADPEFIPKCDYLFNGQKVIAFFLSELEKGLDVYTQLVTIDNDVKEDDHRLFLWKHNKNYDIDYIKTPISSSGSFRYLIPIEELELIGKEEDVEEEEELVIEVNDPDQDLPLNQMTIRDLAAIITGKPVSMKKWLNEIVNSK